MDNPEPILSVSFFKTETGREPVREWLKSLSREQRRIIGEDINDRAIRLAARNAAGSQT